MGVPGIWEMVIIGGVIVLLFGAKKLPSLGGAIGESIKNFKKGIRDAGDEGKAIDTPKTTGTAESNDNKKV